jgi:hypothetical protein
MRLVEELPSNRDRFCMDVWTLPLTALVGAPFDWLLGVLRDFILCAVGVARRFPKLDVARLPRFRQRPARGSLTTGEIRRTAAEVLVFAQ